MRLLSWSLVFAPVLVFLSCGGPAAPNAANVSLIITPATATIAAGGSVALRGDAAGFTRTPLVSWYMQEGTGTSKAPYCGLDSTATPPAATDCPAGYVMFNTKLSGVPSAATYHAPSAAGVYHVVFLASQNDGYKTELIKTSTAEITVTP